LPRLLNLLLDLHHLSHYFLLHVCFDSS
jgi:hypothetical protein